MNRSERRWYSKWWAVVLLLAAVLGVLGIVTVRALGLTTVAVDASPFELSEEGFDYSWWNEALAEFVHDGGVDYDAVLAQDDELRRFVATLSVAGPNTTPERFRTEPEKLAYYVNAYNALTLLGVVSHWPIATVHDVHGWIDPRAGFGFFYGLRFPLDGGEINLYDLENAIIRPFLDARIHAAINCASKSCPALAPYAFEPATLDEQFDAVTREFCSNPPHVVIDEEAQKIRLSAIFDWYRADFEEHARRLGRPATLEGFISAFATRDVADALSEAKEAEFEVVFEPYDWSLNQL
jgi:hypothetical protein